MNDQSAVLRQDEALTRADLEYVLPPGLIAQQPLPRRDASRLLVLDRASRELRDGRVVELPDLLRPGDVLVLNDTKVLPAKFIARRQTGGVVRGLFEREERPHRWRVLLNGSRRLRAGETLTMEGGEPGTAELRLIGPCGAGAWRVEVRATGPTEAILNRVGYAPLPPYLHRRRCNGTSDADDRTRYQTVYARRPGAIAAPTAGLHLTNELLDRIRLRGIETAFVTLHVGAGTFTPIRVHDLAEHRMHAEWFEVTRDAADAVTRCRRRGGRVVAVGTTTVRVLESAAHAPPATAEETRTTGHAEPPGVSAGSGWTDRFIYPPYRFQGVDALLTNFHLPGSTLLALVAALAGVDSIRRAYAHAIEQRYRFYSFGDAMLIL